ncbi:uncharacterized protein METZ01_LOCUS265282, partial [marine metagenome]
MGRVVVGCLAIQWITGLWGRLAAGIGVDGLYGIADGEGLGGVLPVL